MQGKEIEFKYSADNIVLSDFNDFCERRDPLKILLVSGYDRFFSSKADPAVFFRHRRNTNENELTFKRKLSKDNNYIRTEHNMTLSLDMTNDSVTACLKELGYEYNSTIFKNCFIYNYDYYTLVYYICFDQDMKEAGRFIEIELKEDYEWESETEAWTALVVLEKTCSKLGLSSDMRINQSLYEMFKK